MPPRGWREERGARSNSAMSLLCPGPARAAGGLSSKSRSLLSSKWLLSATPDTPPSSEKLGQSSSGKVILRIALAQLQEPSFFFFIQL